MSNPSEGPGPTEALRDGLAQRGFTPEQADVFVQWAEVQRGLFAEQQARLEAMQQQIAAQQAAAQQASAQQAGRGRRAAPFVATAAGAAAVASDQGQSVIGDVGRWTGDQAAAFGQYASEQYTAAKDGLQAFGQDVAREASQQWNSAVEGVQQFGQDFAREASQQWNSAVEGAQSAASAVSGWAVETWHSVAEPVSNAAQSVGAWASQYADSVAANPGNAAATAALAAGAVVAATPQLRQAVGQAANAASRWGRGAVQATTDAVRNAPSRLAQLGRNAMEGAKKFYDHARTDPRVDYALSRMGVQPRQVNEAATEAANGVTSPETTLPKAAEVQAGLEQKALGQDGSQASASRAVVAAEAAKTTGASTEQGEAATAQGKGLNSKVERGGQGQGR
ncbi:hypothetical protein ACIBL3_23165 [Kribbella sp. NPDC050124]|uniref:hypothetical protein n=1 Tax=Kribbella sp. NPDC050124 TaxID=3364114 RepID=UPI00379D1AB1